MGSEKFCLRWNDFESNISSAFRELRDDNDFFDVTLACDDEQIQAHKVILSACSPFFRNILRRNPHQNPLLYLKGVKFTDLQSVLNFMYHGEVNVAQEELNSFLAVAEDLRVKGLTQNNSNNPKQKDTYQQPPPPKSSTVLTRPTDRDPIPTINRPRSTPVTPITQSYQHDDDDIQEVVPFKSEPNDHPVPPTPSFSPPAPHPPLVSPATDQQHAGQLQQLDDSMYGADDSYEDYGGYDANQGYEAAQGIEAMAMVDQAKGNISSPEDFKKYLERDATGPYCGICQQFDNKSVTNVRNHVEYKHFPNVFNYQCNQCDMSFGTNKALDIHRQRTHKKVPLY